MKEQECIVPGCTKRRKGAYRMCSMHLKRKLLNQPLDNVPRKVGKPKGCPATAGSFKAGTPREEHARWLGDAAGYGAVHRRLRFERGDPNDQPCARCGKTVGRRDWCFDEPVGYSPELDRYEVRCVSCERRISHAQLRDCWYEAHPDTLRKPGHPATV